MILCPYLAQLKLTQRALDYTGNEMLRSLRVITFDSCQGGEAEVIIMPIVCTERIGFMRAIDRINVAISRARSLLFIVGDHEFTRDTEYKRCLLAKVHKVIMSRRMIFNTQEWDLKPDISGMLVV